MAMSINDTPRANRPHIAIFGRRNAGKSSLINAITGQEIALVSEQAGTTTDPVYKSMEILPLGPCILIDTAGIDDEGTLGQLRVKKTREVLEKSDLAILIIDPALGISNFEKDLLHSFDQQGVPVLAILNKIDLFTGEIVELEIELGLNLHPVSTLTGEGIEELKELIAQHTPSNYTQESIIGDLLSPGDLCLLVTPIDSAAPRGRLILPQVQTIRDILDHNAQALVVKETELPAALASLKQPPRLVITDSQAFKEVSALIDSSIPLTSFSILFARYKADLKSMMEGIKAVENLKPGDKVLIAEACTHHRQEDDIGTIKIPRLLEKQVGGKLDINWYSGSSYPEDLESYKLIVHCGACMLNRKQMLSRLRKAQEKNVPIVNYGVFLAYMNGILERTTAIFQ
ncbi:MAG: [FeFe] hydrogenase H-cluster maturation GTPase HydF [Syntrophomonadaceae bacterium]|nr:[FeFe] hydrogenase H-cluster maturation GTPase HydF [Syntrophomonadaceae bacterium]